MPLDQVLKQHFWIPLLVPTAGAAYLHAQIISAIIGGRLSLRADELLPSVPSSALRSPKAVLFHTKSADPILARNPFDSVTGPLDKVAVEPTPLAALASVSDAEDAPACEGVSVRIITESNDPTWSFAALTGPDGKSILRRQGDEIDGKTVRFVGWDTVWLAGAAGLCRIRLFDPAPKHSAPVAATPAPAAPARGPGSVDPAISKGIQRVSATEFNIDRGVVDKILENQADLMRQARIVPEQQDGKMVGIRLFGVRPETLLGILGMQNGDRLQTINGFDMTSPEKALEAYARLRTADHLTVQVNRSGQNTNLDYNIR